MPAGTPNMSEDNKRLVRRALNEVYENGTLELADELVHPTFVDHEPAHADEFTGPESIKRTAARLLDAFGDLRSTSRMRSPKATRSSNL